MDLSAWKDTLSRELPRLWKCLGGNVYPEAFLTRVLGFSAKFCEHLPQYLMCFLGLYLLCGALTVFFRFRLGQKPLSSIPRQAGTAVLAACCTVCLPLLMYLAKLCAYIVRDQVAPMQGWGDCIRYTSEALSNIVYVIAAFVCVLLTVWAPAGSMFRYLKTYRLRGIPHMILEVGAGFYLLCVLLLASAFESRQLYALILPAGLLLGTVQSAGCPSLTLPEPDEVCEILLSAESAQAQAPQEKNPKGGWSD